MFGTACTVNAPRASPPRPPDRTACGGYRPPPPLSRSLTPTPPLPGAPAAGGTPTARSRRYPSGHTRRAPRRAAPSPAAVSPAEPSLTPPPSRAAAVAPSAPPLQRTAGDACPPPPPPHPTRVAAAGRATRPASRPGRPPLPPPSRFLPRPPPHPAERPWWWWLGPSPRPAHPVSFLFGPSPSRASGGRPATPSLLLPPPLPPPLFFFPVAFLLSTHRRPFLLSTHRRPPILHLPLFFFGHHPPRPAAPHRANLSARRLRAAPVGLRSPLCRRLACAGAN